MNVLYTPKFVMAAIAEFENAYSTGRQVAI